MLHNKLNDDVIVWQYKYPVEEQTLKWFRMPVEMSESLSTPHFNVQGEPVNTTEVYSSLGHNYTKLCANIKFNRKLTQYMFVMYFPSFALTGLSFLNFWLDKKAVPARASLSITSILGTKLITFLGLLTTQNPSRIFYIREHSWRKKRNTFRLAKYKINSRSFWRGFDKIPGFKWYLERQFCVFEKFSEKSPFLRSLTDLLWHIGSYKSKTQPRLNMYQS